MNYQSLLANNLKEHFTITTDHIICDEMFNIHAVMENNYQKPHIFIPSKKTDVVSFEIVLYKEIKNLDLEEFLNFTKILEQIEYNFPQKTKEDHAFTFFSLYIKAENIEADAIKAVKKYKFDKNYKKCGFLSTRVCVINNDKFITNTFGKDITFRLKEKK